MYKAIAPQCRNLGYNPGKYSRIYHWNGVSEQGRSKERSHREAFGAGWRAERKCQQDWKKFSHTNTDGLTIPINHAGIKVLLSDGFPFNTYCLMRKKKKERKRKRSKHITYKTKFRSTLKCLSNYTKTGCDLISRRGREDTVSSVILAGFYGCFPSQLYLSGATCQALIDTSITIIH